jgi:uncharacterized membrane protein YfcA
VGTFGTFVGAAGGFLLVPILLFIYPDETASTVTSITLTVAFFNAISGSIAYGRLKRIDYRSGLIFAAAAIPGAVLGAYVVSYLSRDVFQYVFGAILIIVAAYLVLRPEKKLNAGILLKCQTSREITDRQGSVHSYSFNQPLGMALAFCIGVLSSLLGIGGGIIHVPVMTQLLFFPIHIATATSQFVIVISTFSAIMTHVADGTYANEVGKVVVLAVGAIIGAQVGARLSQRVKGKYIIRILAAGLAVVAIRLLIAPV